MTYKTFTIGHRNHNINDIIKFGKQIQIKPNVLPYSIYSKIAKTLLKEDEYIPSEIPIEVAVKHATGTGNGKGDLEKIKEDAQIYLYIPLEIRDNGLTKTLNYLLRIFYYSDITNSLQLSKKASSLSKGLRKFKKDPKGLEKIMVGKN